MIASFEKLAKFAEAKPSSGSKDWTVHPDLARLASDLRDGRPLCGIAHEAEKLGNSGSHNEMDAARLRCLAKRIKRTLSKQS